MEDVLGNLEGLREQSAEQRNDRAEMFKRDPVVIKYLADNTAEIPAIGELRKLFDSDMRRADRLNANLADSTIHSGLMEWRLGLAAPAKIEAIQQRVSHLIDSDFNATPYPRSQDDWAIVVRRMLNEVTDGGCNFTGTATALKRAHEQVMSRLAEIAKTSRAQGRSPFQPKPATVMPEAAMSSDHIDFADRD